MSSAVELLQLVPPAWRTPAILAVVLLGPLGLWLTGITSQWRRDRREDGVAAGEALSKVVRQLQDELARTASISAGYLAELERVRQARYELQDMLAALRDQAVAARTMVHELQRAQGLAETVFEALPAPVFRPPG